MALLRVTHRGQEISSLELDPSKEYIVGRAPQCDITLPSEPGLSRQHLRIFYDGQSWQVEMMSRYGGLLFNGDSVEKLALAGTSTFSLPPFEFTFTDALTPPMPAVEIPEQPEVAEIPEVEVAAFQPEFEPISENSTDSDKDNNDQSNTADPSGNLDSTVVAKVAVIPYLQIRNLKTKIDETVKLEGHAWKLGRHPDSEIVINDSAISRRHFQIQKDGDNFLITDLGSSNGTKVNGERIEKAHPLRSGDVISIRHLEMLFEIRDSDFEIRAQALPPNYLPSTIENSNFSDEAAVVRLPDQPIPSGILQNLAQNKIRVVIGILALLLIYGLTGEDKPTSGNSQDLTSQTPDQPVELTSEQKFLARDTFKLANSYFMQQKYEFCLSQIEKLHDLVPYYENSKEIENLCRQGIELQQINEDRERKLQEQQAVENKVRSIVSGCSAQLTTSTTSAELQICLQGALELDPQNPDVLALMQTVQNQENQANAEIEKARRFAERKAEGQSLYENAMSQLKSGNLKSAQRKFKQFVSGRYPGLNQQEDEAQRMIASIEQKEKQRISELLATCRGAVDRKELKAAITSCEEVLKEDRGNKEAREQKDKAWNLLRREMKSLYQDSVLEESLGNVEAAKQKWQKIKETSVPGEDYFEKAKKKLERYGAAL